MRVQIISNLNETFICPKIITEKGNPLKFDKGAFFYDLDNENYEKLKKDGMVQAFIKKGVLEIHEIEDEEAAKENAEKVVREMNMKEDRYKALTEKTRGIEAELIAIEKREDLLNTEYAKKYLSKESADSNKQNKTLIKEIIDKIYEKGKKEIEGE